MKVKLLFILSLFILISGFGCNAKYKKNELEKNDSFSKIQDTPFNKKIVLKESFNEDDLILNEILSDNLKLIRANFKRINSITNWTTIDKKQLSESTEGGEANFYYLKEQIEKIVVKNFGETSQYLTEYYLLKGSLSFVFEKIYKYNRPIYFDSSKMKENNDAEKFDFTKSGIIENRSYFQRGKLIHQLNNQDSSSIFTADYLKNEENRIVTDYNKLIKMLPKK